MARGKKKESALTPEEKLEWALVPESDWPYKVPQNWCWTRLNYLSKHISDGSHNPPRDSGSGIPLLSATNVRDHTIDVDNVARWITEEEWKTENQRTQIEPNDVLLTIVATLGRTAVVKNEKFALQRSVAVIKPKINSEYLSYYFESPYVQTFMVDNAKGTAQKGFYLNSLEKLFCCVPPLSEQQRIVARIESLFAKLDEAKEKAQTVLDSFETRKAAILHKAFTGELTAKWRAEHGEQEWNIVTLGDVCRFENGYAFKSDRFSETEGVPVVRISNISEMGVDIDGCVLTTEVAVDKRFQIQYGDLLIAMSGATTGKNGVYLSKKTAFLNQRVGNIKIKDPSRLVPGYRNYYILHMRETILQNAYGGAQPNISSGKICLMEFPLSSFEEQTEIVRILDSLFAKEQQAKEVAEAILEQIDLLKKSILARAFRGELGTNDPSDESAVELLKQVL